MPFVQNGIFSHFWRRFKKNQLVLAMSFIKNLISFVLCFSAFNFLISQPERWQQRVEYQMDIDLDVSKHQMTGYQRLRLFNNSPDTLDRVFYHLYFNAFQPNSSMDVYNQDPMKADPRVRSRIASLKEHEMGWHKIQSLKLNGKDCRFEVNETILEVTLPEPVMPRSVALLEMDFRSQVPVQIRRSGRDSQDGIAYSMSQWYPKLCEYDYQGWHANPYVQREFYGVWGNFEVNISIDKKYILGASGVLQNPQEIGFGYQQPGSTVMPPAADKLTWRWKAENVHDFSWSVDPDYKHVTVERKDGLVLHFLYEENERTRETWSAMPAVMDKAFDYINANFGQYPYQCYAFLQAGDGGMEYPMATFLTGSSGVGTFLHELMHAWYYGLLGTNESLHPWMDEGFTEYAEEEVKNFLKKEKRISGNPVDNPHLGANENYIAFAKSGLEEPLSTHHDHYLSSRAASTAAYVKGHVFLTQLQYVMGKPTFDKAMLRYFDTWKFKHPNPNDFIRIMEKSSGLELDWYKEYFVFTTKTIDYGVRSVEKANRKETHIILEKKGHMPMPIDLLVTYKSGEKEVFNIPLELMRGAKPNEFGAAKYTVLPDWRWTHPTYEIVLGEKIKNVVKVEIDPSRRMADVESANNRWEKTPADTDETED
jgi:hypothetical protein